MICIGDGKEDNDREAANQADAQPRQGPPPQQQTQWVNEEQHNIAVTWDDDASFFRSHEKYGTAVSKLSPDQKDQLKAWKADRKYGRWMQPHEFDKTMAAIRALNDGKSIAEVPQKPSDSSVETSDQPEPPAPLPVTPPPVPVEREAPKTEAVTWGGTPVEDMGTRDVLKALSELGQPTNGSAQEARERLREAIINEHARLDEEEKSEGGEPGEMTGNECSWCGSDPCECNAEGQVAQGTPPAQAVEYAEDDPGRPF